MTITRDMRKLPTFVAIPTQERRVLLSDLYFPATLSTMGIKRNEVSLNELLRATVACLYEFDPEEGEDAYFMLARLIGEIQKGVYLMQFDTSFPNDWDEEHNKSFSKLKTAHAGVVLELALVIQQELEKLGLLQYRYKLVDPDAAVARKAYQEDSDMLLLTKDF